jgi:hypothetical protein
MRIRVCHNDAYYFLELRLHPDGAVGFEVTAFEPWPEAATLRRVIFDKALLLAAKAATAAARESAP